jgi:cytochrome c biogenesis protein CcdA
MSLEVLPLAITMMAGPQIMSAVIFATSERALSASAAFVAGVAIGTTVGTAIALGLADLAKDSLGQSDDSGSGGSVIQYALVGLLIAGAIKNYLGRETVEPPKWLGTLLSADWKRALRTGLLVILAMPSDIIVMLTVGVNLGHADGSLADALPFIAATVAIAALPLLLYLLFHRRAKRAAPKLRAWMNANSWLVNIFVCLLFIVLLVA